MTDMELIEIITIFGYKVEDHGNGKYTVTDPCDNLDGWRIVNSDSALKDTYDMIISIDVMYNRGWSDGYYDELPNTNYKDNIHYMNGFEQGVKDS